MRWRISATAFLIASLTWAQNKQEKPKDKPLPPKPLFALQLAASPGKTTALTLRGLRLDTATEIRVGEPKSQGKLLGKSRKVNVPNQMNAEVVGDTEIEVEITLPAEVSGGAIPIQLIGPGGEGPPVKIMIQGDLPIIDEKEPNNGFPEAQPITAPVCVRGTIRNGQDVDVYRLEGKAGETLRVEVIARRTGSPVDPMLTLFNQSGQILTLGKPKDGDAYLEHVCKKDEPLFLSVIDAHDQGESFFVYHLLIRK